MKNLMIFLVFILTPYFARSQNIHKERKLSIFSKYLKENTDILVKLPDGFEKNKLQCSLLVLLDGDEYFGMATDIESLFQSAGKMPSTVVVAIPSTIEKRWKYYTPTNSKNISGNSENDKLFQSTGHFDEFSKFIKYEVIRYLEKKYGVKFINKTIFGHSLGGLAVISFYNLKAEIFQNYICASPSLLWDNFMFNHYYSEKFPSNTKESRKIFLSAGNPDMNGYKNNVEDLVESLRSKISNAREMVNYVHYENEDHETTGIRSLVDGLEFIYAK